jgi:hypothetical protein
MYCDHETGQYYLFEYKPSFKKESKGWKKFLRQHHRNPHIYDTYKSLILNEIASGRDKYAICFVTERARWDNKFKISNNHKPYYSRIFVEEFPQYEGFFDFRPLSQD